MTIDATVIFTLFLAALLSFAAGAIGALMTARSPAVARIVGHGGALLGASAALVFGIAGLAGGSMQLNLPDLLPIGGAVFGVDRLSAFFVAVIALGARASGPQATASAADWSRFHSSSRSTSSCTRTTRSVRSCGPRSTHPT